MLNWETEGKPLAVKLTPEQAKEKGISEWRIKGCCKRCWYAKRKQCRCRCQGQHHGKGLNPKNDQVVILRRKMKIDNRQDFFGERGCCIDCQETTKKTMRQRDVFQAGKHYSCLCDECLCVKCSWLYNRVCQRKWFRSNKLPIGGE